MADWTGLERDVPVRLADRRRCFRGHDLKIATAGVGFSRSLQLPTRTCNVCWDLRDPLASWAEVDPIHQVAVDAVPAEGLALVRVPPAAPRGGVGQIQLQVDGETLGDVDIAVCAPCKRAVLEQVRVDESHRRRGYGRVLVAAAVALAPMCNWSSTTVNRHDPIARAFWAAVNFPGVLGEPARCTDMQRAAGTLPDW